VWQQLVIALSGQTVISQFCELTADSGLATLTAVSSVNWQLTPDRWHWRSVQWTADWSCHLLLDQHTLRYPTGIYWQLCFYKFGTVFLYGSALSSGDSMFHSSIRNSPFYQRHKSRQLSCCSLSLSRCFLQFAVLLSVTYTIKPYHSQCPFYRVPEHYSLSV
jgi:hypothetical protein